MSTSSYNVSTLPEIDAIHTNLRNGFRSGKTKSIPFRKQQLLQLCYMLDDNKERIYDALASDLGRSTIETNLLEMAGSLGEAKLAYDSVEKWSRTESVHWQFNYFLSRPAVRKEPKGVVLIIVPFNYPLWLLISPLAGAIAAGNAVVVKPSELIPATSGLFADLFAKYLDPSLYHIVNGAVSETTHLLTLPWDHILYTGNGRVGRIVATAAAKHLTPVTLELGGKSPVVIDPNCDLKTAARRILWAKTANAGQTCVAPDYVIIPKEGVDDLVRELKAVHAEFFPEGPANSKSYSRVVTSGHFDRLKGLLDHTSGEIVIGGESDASTKYISPTVVKDVSTDDSLMSEEIFGPILPIVAVKNIEEAIQFISERDHPLALYIFTQSSAFKNEVINNTQSGSAIVNDCLMHCVVDGLPFGGVGPSGSGGYHTGKFSFDMFTHLRGTLDNPGWMDMIMKFRYAPLTESKNKQMKMAMFPSLPSRSGVKVNSSTL